MVITHAQTIRPATPQRTADSRRVEPAPTIAPVMVWVVETGMPRKVARYSEVAAAVSAEKPPIGLSAVIFCPRVLTIRQPPDSVPSAIALLASRTTQKGTGSLPPGPSWSRRNRCSTMRGVDPLNSHISPSISTNAKNIPSSGDTTMKITVFSKLGAFTTLQPALAMPAPTTPPISACDDEVGRPSHQVVRFQAMAPTRPPNTTASLTTFGSMIVPTVLATWVRKTAKAMKLKKAAQTTANRGLSTLVETTVAIELAASWKPLE